MIAHEWKINWNGQIKLVIGYNGAMAKLIFLIYSNLHRLINPFNVQREGYTTAISIF